MIPVYRPFLNPTSLQYAHKALDSTWISSHGEYITQIEERLVKLLGVKHVLAVNNGTSATHLVAKALQFAHPEIKKIIVPNNVYVAAINSFLFDKEYLLIAVDTDTQTWNYNLTALAEAIQANPGNLAVLVVNNVGNVLNVPKLQREYPEVVFVEDNCEGFLGKYENRYSGTASLASSISFFGNKNITSGEGGAVMTNDTEVYNYLRCIHGQGQSSTRFLHKELGYNYRMTNIQAAILNGQLDQLDKILEMKSRVFDFYRNSIGTLPGVEIQAIAPDTEHSNWMFGVRVRGNLYGYSGAEEFFKKLGVEIRPMFYPISCHTHLRNEKLLSFFGQQSNADTLNAECFILPSFPELTQVELKAIYDAFVAFLKALKGTV